MATYSDYFGKTDKGVELYSILNQMGEQERIDFLASAEVTKPGISEEYNIKSSMEQMGPEGLIKDYGTARGYTSEGLAGLSSDIAAANKDLIELEKGTIDEHLLAIEQLSGLELMGKAPDGKPLYDSAYTFLMDASKSFSAYIRSLKDQNISKKEIDRIQSNWDTSIEKLWPGAPGSAQRRKKFDTIEDKKFIWPSEYKQLQSPNPELEELYELSKYIEINTDYYNKQFIDPTTNEQSEMARELYELSQQ